MFFFGEYKLVTCFKHDKTQSYYLTLNNNKKKLFRIYEKRIIGLHGFEISYLSAIRTLIYFTEDIKNVFCLIKDYPKYP